MMSKESLIEIISSNVEQFNNEVKAMGENADLTELDFSNLNVEDAVFENVDLTSSTFSDSHFTNVKFEGCDLTSVDFTRATLVECSFNESILNGADFSYATVDYCSFNDADLAGAIFQSANLSDSDFSMSENMSACRFDEDTIWPDNEYLPEDFDTNYSSDLSSLQDDDDYEQPSDY